MDAIIEENVTIGQSSVVEPFCWIGKPGPTSGPTLIGNNATVRSHTVIYSSTRIGARFQSGHHVLIRHECVLADDVSLGSFSCLEFGVTISDRVRIHSHVFIPELTTIGAGAWIGPRVVLTNAKYPANEATKDRLAGVAIEAGAIVGANATILPGLTLGTRSLVGAGSVVTKDVPPRTVVVGNPAKPIGTIDRIEDYRSVLF